MTTPSKSAITKNSKSLHDYQLGDSLGKGAFGQVYRALNWATGETVAVKEITLSNIPKSELGEIMSEIDLLKNLNHPNIVKYKGFVKTREFLYIILEFCENGSLHGIIKRFGKFPETLVAVYISQVLQGLVYLHDQGVIHRDIKGANILTNKDGTVKLADFGVASSTQTGSNNDVVGSPYWMAPEVIEQTGATTASDIWSVGCLVIELLEGYPPYHDLDPMPALFRIVQDDCPPIPEGASPIVKDFLLHCFQKDCNLRISAKKLLRHPWMVSARRQLGITESASTGSANNASSGDAPVAGTSSRAGTGSGTGEAVGSGSGAGAGKETTRNGTSTGGPSTQQQDVSAAFDPLGRRASNYNYDEAVLKVQEWNQALKSPSRPSKHPGRDREQRERERQSFYRPGSPTRERLGSGLNAGVALGAGAGGSGMATGLGMAISPPEGHGHLPLNMSVGMMPLSSATSAGNVASLGLGMGIAGRKMNSAAVPNLVDKIQPLSFVLSPPEEQTDNWDDDFEEGISFTKLQALEKPSESESDSDAKHEDDAQTIKPTRSPRPTTIPLSRAGAPSSEINPIIEDYSDLAADEDENALQNKLSEFKMKNSIRRGLFHPDDIKIYAHGSGNTSPGPRTAPLPDIGLGSPSVSPFNTTSNRRSSQSNSGSGSRSRPALNPIVPPSGSPVLGPSSASASSSLQRSHGRSSSLFGSNLRGSPSPTPGSGSGFGTGTSMGSLGRAQGDGTRRVHSASAVATVREFDKYTEYMEDEDEDYDDVFGKPMGGLGGTGGGGRGGSGGRGSGGSGEEGSDDGFDSEIGMAELKLNTRLSNRSWLGDDDDDEDPFAEIDEGFSEEDLEANLQRDKYARLCNQVNSLIDQLTPSAPDFQLSDACDQLLTIMADTPDMQVQLVSSHGMLAILEVLEGKRNRDVTIKLLQMINVLVTEDIGFLESFCLIGGIPVMMGFTSKKHPSECRLEASHFIQLLCHTSVLTLQMFISCRGLKVLVDLLDEDYSEQADLVVHALNGIGSVFELQSPTTKNDFCRMFIREGLLDPLSSALLNVMANRGSSSKEMKMKIIQILLVFSQVSQSDIHVRNALGTRKVVRRLLRACELLEPDCLVQMLKVVKYLSISMNAALLDTLQNANALEILIRILDEQSSSPHSTEMSNHIFQTCYNLCRLNKSRQEEAAQAGIIPCLKRVIETKSPLKQFALPILCDLAGAGKSCRTLLWQHDGLTMYLKLLDDPYFQVSALESIISWLQDETSRVEDVLTQPESMNSILNCFVTSKAVSFENLLDLFLRMTRISTHIAIGLAKSSAFFKRIVDRLTQNTKAIVRLNLLRILKTVCEVHPNRAMLVEKYGLLGVVEGLSRSGGDGAVLVKELAREIVPVLRPGLKPATGSGGPNGSRIASRNGIGSGITPKRMRRTASETSAMTIGTAGGAGTGSTNTLGSTTRPGGTRRARQRLGDIAWQGQGQADSGSGSRK